VLRDPIVLTILGNGGLALLIAYYVHKVTTDSNGNTSISVGTLSAGEDLVRNVQGTQLKPTADGMYATTEYRSLHEATSAKVMQGAVNMYAFRFSSSDSSVVYIHFFNGINSPAEATIPQLSYLVQAGTDRKPSILQLDSAFFAPSEHFWDGLSWGVSSTKETFTEVAMSTKYSIHVRYK
jgi:hypothetical protein